MYTATLEPLLRECNEAVELAKAGDIEKKVVSEAIRKFNLDPEKLNPLLA